MDARFRVKEQKGGGKPPHSKAALRAAGCRFISPSTSERARFAYPQGWIYHEVQIRP
jgi:hypothetical protein